MIQVKEKRISDLLFILSLSLIVYMPLHVFIVQSASLLTGGVEVWKAAKDVLVFVLSPSLLFLSYKRGLFQDKTFRRIAILGALYALIHGLYLLFDQNDDNYSTIVGSVYNTRLLIFMLLGYLVGSSNDGQKYLKYLLTATVLIASVVSLFGVAQYFLPHDLLENVGYSIERGVKPMFFIDDKPDLPRIMSTLKDPNSFGSYLIVPILLTGYAFLKKSIRKELFIRPFRREILGVMLSVQLTALFLTFSRGALIALVISTATMLGVATRGRAWDFLKRHLGIMLLLIILASSLVILFRNTYVFQNYVFHADQSTVLADPNELRVSLTQDALEDVIESPGGHGPGTAGLVSINNPKGGILTENYYLQIAYEVGWLGLALFVAILFVVIKKLYFTIHSSPLTAIMLASMVGYLFYSLLIHLWSNEAVALQWWLILGVVMGANYGYFSSKKSQ